MYITFDSSPTTEQQGSHLIDFSFTSDYLCALWRTARGKFRLEITDREEKLESVVIEPGVTADLEYDKGHLLPLLLVSPLLSVSSPISSLRPGAESIVSSSVFLSPGELNLIIYFNPSN